MSAPSAPPSLPVRAFLFDMDGLLLNTEEIYVRSYKKIINQNGGSKAVPWAMVAEMQSMPATQNDLDVIAYSGIDISLEDYQRQQNEIHSEDFKHCEVLPGVKKLFDTLTSGELSNPPYFALVTSSSKAMMAVKTEPHREIFDRFSRDLLIVGEDCRIIKGRGKPHPDIYLLALSIINRKIAPDVIKPEECLVFEDSKAGVIGARAAGMRTVWIPHQEIRKAYLGRESDFLSSPLGTAAYLERAAKDDEFEPLQPDADAPPSITLDNEWIELLDSMESFRFERYGLRAV